MIFFCFFMCPLQISTLNIYNFYNEKTIVKTLLLSQSVVSHYKVKPKSCESKWLFSIHFSRKSISLEKYKSFEDAAIILIVKDSQ